MRLLFIGDVVGKPGREGFASALPSLRAERGVGDAESANLVELLPPFGASWSGLEKSAVRQIKQKVRQAKGSRG